MGTIIKIFCALIFMLSFLGLTFGFLEIVNGAIFIGEGEYLGYVITMLGMMIFILSGKVGSESMKIVMS